MCENERPVVSIVCAAYNHEKYIREALEGFVSQKTSFKYEVIVHDDCSQDNTAQIIAEYADKYPDLIVPIFENENQYSKNTGIFSDICIPRTRGKYIAFCEGDDYWCDENKLQMQYNALEKHRELNMCACGAKVISDIEGKHLYDVVPKKDDCILTSSEVIAGGGRYLATASLFMRRDILLDRMKFENRKFNDYVMQIRGSLYGGIYFISRVMAVYRVSTDDSWSSNIETNEKKRVQHISKEIEMLNLLDEETNYIYHDVIVNRIVVYSSANREFNSSVLNEIEKHKGYVFVWGLGIVGNSFLQYLNKKGVEIDGICDIKNIGIGQKDEYGNQIYSTEYVLKNAKLIIVTNSYAYESICNDCMYDGKVLNLQDAQ